MSQKYLRKQNQEVEFEPKDQEEQEEGEEVAEPAPQETEDDPEAAAPTEEITFP